MHTDRIRVVAAVIARGQKFLVCQRPHDNRYGGMWEFPGGKCEQNESIDAAVRRELREELGVEVTEIGDAEFCVQDPGSEYVIIFAPVQISGEPSCHEHAALQWSGPNDLAKLPLAPSDRRYVQNRLIGDQDH